MLEGWECQGLVRGWFGTGYIPPCAGVFWRCVTTATNTCSKVPGYMHFAGPHHKPGKTASDCENCRDFSVRTDFRSSPPAFRQARESSTNGAMRGPSPLLRTARALRSQPANYVCWQCRGIQISATPSTTAGGDAFGAIENLRDTAGMALLLL